MSPLRIKCKFCDEMVLNKQNHYCSAKRSFIGVDSDAEDFRAAFISAATVGALYGDTPPICNDVSTDTSCNTFDTSYCETIW
jgi:hypothetical protein